MVKDTFSWPRGQGHGLDDSKSDEYYIVCYGRLHHSLLLLDKLHCCCYMSLYFQLI